MRYFFAIGTFLTLSLFASCQKETEFEPDTPMKVKNYEGHIHVGFFTENKNMEVSFYPCGVNQLFGIAQVSYFSDLTDHKQGIISNQFKSGTDWIGPYFVCSEENVNKGLPQQFTGGWHGSNGDGTGAPTASTYELSFVVDGEETSENFDRNCTQVDLYATNLIHGYDYAETNKNLLKETVHYTILTNRQIDVHVKIEALEDLIIQRYYGLQSQNFALFDSVKYMANAEVINTAAINTNSSCQSNDGVNTILLTDSNSQHQLKLTLNTSEGLGVFENLGNGLQKAFSASYGKSYFNLINGKNLLLKKGEEVFWEGTYLWDEG